MNKFVYNIETTGNLTHIFDILIDSRYTVTADFIKVTITVETIFTAEDFETFLDVILHNKKENKYRLVAVYFNGQLTYSEQD